MPSHILAPIKSRPKPLQRKAIKKEPKIARINSNLSPSDCDCVDENTMSETTQFRMQEESASSLKETAQILKHSIFRFKYSIDTYIVCLTMLAQLKFEIPQGKTKLIASALLLIAAKVHEFRTPKYVELLKLGEHEFGSGDLTTTEAWLLGKLGFRVPVVLQLASMKAMQQQATRLQTELFLLPSNFQ